MNFAGQIYRCVKYNLASNAQKFYEKEGFEKRPI